VDIIIYNCAFSENHQSILHALPPLVVKTTCVLQIFLLFSQLTYPTSNFDMGFMLSLHIPFHFHDYLMFPLQDFDDLPPNPIMVVNFKSPFNSSCFTILSFLKSIDHIAVFMVSTT
jgi:hypothetical protein